MTPICQPKGGEGVVTVSDISAGQGPGSGREPSAVIDKPNAKLLVATTHCGNSCKPALFRCNLDGTGCTYTDISAGQGVDSGWFPSVVVDTANGKLLVVTDGPTLFRCNLDGTGCTYSDISAGQGVGSGVLPSTVIDTTNAKLLVAATSWTNSFKLALFRCNLDGTSCTYTDISGVRDGPLPSAVIDSVNGKLLVVTQVGTAWGRPALFRCNLDATGCTYTDISSGRALDWGLSVGIDYGWAPSVVIDSVNSKLLVVTQIGANSGSLVLLRCNLDGTGCTYTDISAGQRQGSGYSPSAMIDAANDKLLVVTDNQANGDRPALFSVCLQ